MLKTFLKRSAQFIVGLLLVLAVVGVFTRQSLPDNSQRPPSQALPPNPQSLLAQHLLPQMEATPGLSGIYPLREGRDAFLARLSLAETAQHTLDVQYYIWRSDISGRLLTQSLYRAAERGVRVRLLLDDNNTAAFDTEPESGVFKRFAVWFCGLLPIEWLL